MLACWLAGLGRSHDSRSPQPGLAQLARRRLTSSQNASDLISYLALGKTRRGGRQVVESGGRTKARTWAGRLRESVPAAIERGSSGSLVGGLACCPLEMLFSIRQTVAVPQAERADLYRITHAHCGIRRLDEAYSATALQNALRASSHFATLLPSVGIVPSAPEASLWVPLFRARSSRCYVAADGVVQNGGKLARPQGRCQCMYTKGSAKRFTVRNNRLAVTMRPARP